MMPPELETPPSPEPTPEALPTPSLLTEGTPPTSETPPEETPPAPEPEPVVPLAAEDLTFPEGFEVVDTVRDEFLSVVNDPEMSPKDRAQALIDLQIKAATAASEASSKLWADTQSQWQTETKAAPEFAGEKLQPALERIGTLLNEFGSEELKGVLDLTGAGNSVHMVRFLDKVAAQLTESRSPASGAPVNQQGTAASRMFPSMKEG